MTEVLATRHGRDGARPGLDELWAQVESRGWFAGALPRVVVQVGAGGDTGWLAPTVNGLATFLRGRLGVKQVEVLDLAGRDWSPLHMLATSPADVLQVEGLTEPRVTCPRLWFERFFLVTVAGVSADPAARIRCILATQAEPLRAVGWRAARGSRVYEAHRLAGSDLAVACGAAQGQGWWLASPSDVAVDRLVAHAAGLDPERLPDLQAVGRHELFPAVAPVGVLPTIAGLASPAWRAALAHARETAVSAGRFAARDVRAARSRGLHAISRRLKARLQRAGREA